MRARNPQVASADVPFAFVAVVVALLCLACCAGCSSQSGNGQAPSSSQASSLSSSPVSSAAASAGVAATIMGEDIAEDDVTAYIESIREDTQRTTDDAWRAYLDGLGMSAAEFRERALSDLAAPIVVKKKAAELGLAVDEDAVNAEYENMKRSFMVADDAAFDETLAAYHSSVDELRENLRVKNLQEQLYAHVVGDVEPTDDDIFAYVQSGVATDVAKRLTVIRGADYPTMETLLARMQKEATGEGALQVARAEAGSGSVEVSDYGWFIEGTASTQMEEVINSLGKGEMTRDLLPDSGMYQIVYVEDTCPLPADAQGIASLPDDLRRELAARAASEVREKACSQRLRDRIAESITVNDMPEGLPYDVGAPSSEG